LIFFAYTLGALSIIGVPPFVGSWSKFYLILGSLEADYLFVAIILGISSLLNIYYLLEPVFVGFRKKLTKDIHLTNVPLAVWPPAVTGLGCLLLFFYANYFDEIINGVLFL
jgi:NADH:ubiquinone oxidoreductase subunit 2 (chain N)